MSDSPIVQQWAEQIRETDAERRPLDFYETPPWQTEALLSRVDIRGVVFDPCVGDGAISRILKGRGLNVLTNDIDTHRYADAHGDAADIQFWDYGFGLCNGLHARPDWVITNPPFSRALEIVRNARIYARVGVAMLLRVSFPEPTKARGEWLEANPPDVIGYLPRWSYKQNGGSDMATTAWMLWFNDPAERAKYRNWVHATKPARPRLKKAA